MDFAFNETETSLQDLANQILSEQLTPARQLWLDQHGQPFDTALWHTLAEAGLLGAGLPESDGGLGLGFGAIALLQRAGGRVAACLPWQTLVMGALIARWPNKALHGRLAAVCAGHSLLSHAFLAETGELECYPHQGGYRLSGTIGPVPFAEQSEWLLVPVAADEPLLIWLSPASDGVTLVRQACTAGEPQAQLQLESLDVPSEQVQAGGEAARQQTQWVRERLLAAQCSQAVGLVDAMLEMTAEYTRDRHQFGRPIGSFQAVGQRAADMYIDRQCLRLIVDQLVALLSAEQMLSQELAIAKIWCADVLHRSSQSAQHLHGGMGVDRDYPLFRYCLWAKQLELNFGGAAPWLAYLGESIAREFKAVAVSA